MVGWVIAAPPHIKIAMLGRPLLVGWGKRGSPPICKFKCPKMGRPPPPPPKFGPPPSPADGVKGPPAWGTHRMATMRGCEGEPPQTVTPHYRRPSVEGVCLGGPTWGEGRGQLWGERSAVGGAQRCAAPPPPPSKATSGWGVGGLVGGNGVTPLPYGGEGGGRGTQITWGGGEGFHGEGGERF